MTAFRIVSICEMHISHRCGTGAQDSQAASGLDLAVHKQRTLASLKGHHGQSLQRLQHVSNFVHTL